MLTSMPRVSSGVCNPPNRLSYVMNLLKIANEFTAAAAVLQPSLKLPPSYIPRPPWYYQEPRNTRLYQGRTRICCTRVSPHFYADEYPSAIYSCKQRHKQKPLKHGCSGRSELLL
jgi:hypothetical protein